MKTVLSTVRSGALTAWMQTPPGTTPQMFIEAPQVASMTAALAHIKWAREHGVEVLELGAAHSPRTANVPPESMADPVAHHTNMETPKYGEGRDLLEEDAQKLLEACAGEVQIGTLGAFQNLLHVDLSVRRQELEHVRRAIRAAALMREVGLGTEGVTIFVGRDVSKTIEDNMRLFACVVIPLVRYAKEHGMKLYIENCPMCGWSGTAEVFTQNIANVPLHWILICRMLEASGLTDWCFLNYDPSHDILQGTRPEWSFRVMQQSGYKSFIGRFHGKDLSKQFGKLAISGSLGQRVAGGPWAKMNGDQPLPGATEHNPLAMAMGMQVDWLGMMIAARTSLGLDMSKTVFTTEHEHSFFRSAENLGGQEGYWQVAGALVARSIAYIQGVDAAADAHYQMKQVIEQFANAPWSWQPTQDHESDLFYIHTDEVLSAADSWTLPESATTSDLVIGN